MAFRNLIEHPAEKLISRPIQLNSTSVEQTNLKKENTIIELQGCHKLIKRKKRKNSFSDKLNQKNFKSDQTLLTKNKKFLKGVLSDSLSEKISSQTNKSPLEETYIEGINEVNIIDIMSDEEACEAKIYDSGVLKAYEAAKSVDTTTYFVLNNDKNILVTYPRSFIIQHIGENGDLRQKFTLFLNRMNFAYKNTLISRNMITKIGSRYRRFFRIGFTRGDRTNIARETSDFMAWKNPLSMAFSLEDKSFDKDNPATALIFGFLDKLDAEIFRDHCIEENRTLLAPPPTSIGYRAYYKDNKKNIEKTYIESVDFIEFKEIANILNLSDYEDYKSYYLDNIESINSSVDGQEKADYKDEIKFKNLDNVVHVPIIVPQFIYRIPKRRLFRTVEKIKSNIPNKMFTEEGYLGTPAYKIVPRRKKPGAFGDSSAWTPFLYPEYLTRAEKKEFKRYKERIKEKQLLLLEQEWKEERIRKSLGVNIIGPGIRKYRDINDFYAEAKPYELTLEEKKALFRKKEMVEFTFDKNYKIPEYLKDERIADKYVLLPTNYEKISEQIFNLAGKRFIDKMDKIELFKKRITRHFHRIQNLTVFV